MINPNEKREVNIPLVLIQIQATQNVLIEAISRLMAKAEDKPLDETFMKLKVAVEDEIVSLWSNLHVIPEL